MVGCIGRLFPWTILFYDVVKELLGNIFYGGDRLHGLKFHSLQLSGRLYPFIWFHALLYLRVFCFLVFIAALNWRDSWIVSWCLNFLLKFVHLSFDWRDWLALRHNLSLGSKYNRSHFSFSLINSFYSLLWLNFRKSFDLITALIDTVSYSFSFWQAF